MEKGAKSRRKKPRHTRGHSSHASNQVATSAGFLLERLRGEQETAANPRAIVYLNQDFSGGETVFRDQYSKIYPETGKLLMFPAGYDYTHGVTPVRDANRYTIALWFTEDQNQCMY